MAADTRDAPMTRRDARDALWTSGCRPVASHDLGQKIERQRVRRMAVPAGHRLRHRQRIQNRFFRRFGRGLEQRVDAIGRQHVHRADRLAMTYVVAGGKRQEDVAAAVESDPAHWIGSSGASVASTTMIDPASRGMV